jgi:hypothetical protein
MPNSKLFVSPYSKNMNILRWKNNDDNDNARKTRKTPDEFNGYGIITEADLINVWAEYSISESRHKEFPAVDLGIWKWHHYQFGLVILQLANLLYYCKDFRGVEDRYFRTLNTDFEMKGELFFNGPTGSEDRVYYRIWYALIGHPEYIHYLNITTRRNEFDWAGLMMMAIDDLSGSLRE